MTIIEQLQLVQGALTEWAETWKAEALIASDREDVLRRLTETPNKSHCLVYFEAEEPVPDLSNSGGVNRIILVVISRGRGMTINPTTNLVTARGDKLPLYDVLESGRTLLCNLNFTPSQTSHAGNRDEILPVYSGTRPWRGAPQFPLDAFEMEIRILTQLLFE